MQIRDETPAILTFIFRDKQNLYRNKQEIRLIIHKVPGWTRCHRFENSSVGTCFDQMI